MANYQIITDSCCDLPMEMLASLNVKMVSLNLHFRGETLKDSVTEEIKTVYDAWRAGESATTSAANPQQWSEVMEPVLAA